MAVQCCCLSSDNILSCNEVVHKILLNNKIKIPTYTIILKYSQFFTTYLRIYFYLNFLNTSMVSITYHTGILYLVQKKNKKTFVLPFYRHTGLFAGLYECITYSVFWCTGRQYYHFLCSSSLLVHTSSCIFYPG